MLRYRNDFLSYEEAPLLPRAHAAVIASQKWLLGRQAPDGHWVGELEGDTILESEYALLLAFLKGKVTEGEPPPEKLRRAAKYLLKKQLEDGGWSIYPGGPAEVSASTKAYFVLKLAGYSPHEPFMRRAREVILSLGGIEKINSFTKIYLAIFGQYPWEKCPAVPPEIILLPSWFYFNIYAISSWSRTILVPLSIVWASKPLVPVPEERGISELYCERETLHSSGESVHRSTPHAGSRKSSLFSWRNLFLTLDKVLKLAERYHFTPWRKRALKTAEEWMLARFEKSGGLGAIFPPMVNSVMALKCLGYPGDDPTMKQAIHELEHLEIHEGETMRLQPCVSSIWDTALSMVALHESGLPLDHSSMRKAAGWLLSKEVTSPGDWQVYRKNLKPGGWFFEYANEFYPDVDDTAMVLLALRGRGLHSVQDDEEIKACNRGLAWLLGMQGRDGGWASFDADNDRMVFTHIPFADHNAMLDPSTADITGRVLEMLSHYGFSRQDKPVEKGIRFLAECQEPDGSWYGRWGVNYIYGTWQVLKGLTAIGEETTSACVQKGVKWLLQVQHEDGGWGESCETYDDPSLKGQGKSTPSQTAWAVMGLMTAGLVNHQGVKRGIEYLLKTQTPEGTWEEEEFTGTGFPKVFYLGYHLYRHYFPLFALGMYTTLLEKKRWDGHSFPRMIESDPSARSKILSASEGQEGARCDSH